MRGFDSPASYRGVQSPNVHGDRGGGARWAMPTSCINTSFFMNPPWAVRFPRDLAELTDQALQEA
jgi:hypothetical protein